MNEARELIAMKTTIHAALDPSDIPRINFRAMANAAADALARGWTGDEIARHAVEGIYTGEVRDLGAVMLANIRPLAEWNPPREETPIPPPIGQVLAMSRGTNPSRNPTSWANQVREASRKRPNAAATVN